MDVNGVQAITALKPLDLSRHGTPALKPMDFDPYAQAALKPLDLSSRNGQPMQMDGSLDALNAPSAGSHQSQDLERQAQIFVATAFFGTLLKQVRESPFKSELFSGGRGGQAFGSLYDQELAQRMARGAGNKLVHSIVRSLEAKKEYERHSREARQLLHRDQQSPDARTMKAVSTPTTGGRHATAA